MMQQRPEDTYAERREGFAADLDRAVARSRSISRGRMGVFLGLLVPLFTYESAPAGGRLLLIGLTVALLALFVLLVLAHTRSRERERWAEMRVRLCDEGLRRIRRDWTDLPSLGEPPEGDHPYAHDLDLFGSTGLSVLLGSVGTAPGRERLRRWILEPTTQHDARARREAISEFARTVETRESMSALGRLVGAPPASSLRAFVEWAGERGHMPRWLSAASFVLPGAAAVLAVLYWLGTVGLAAPLTPLVLSLLITLKESKSLHREFDRISSGEGGMEDYAKLFRPLTDAPFECPELRRIQDRLSAGDLSAAKQLERLKRLVHLSDSRRSMFHVFLAVPLLWDVHVTRALERWRRTAGQHVEGWLESLAHLDALGGLACARFEHPDWCYPELTDSGDVIQANAIVHPYLSGSTGVPNDVRVGPEGTFLLVTGSNMSGKSTLLRSLGVNVVLAQAGGPVAAERMTLPPVRLQTSMRIRDSLEEGISLFMAELHRLKAVVDAARGGETRVLYLLDEILHGTNTAERQIAARTVLRHLLESGAIGAVTTHDLTLASASDLETAAHAVHFQESFGRDDQGPTLSFDYRLREGLATTTNALALMQLVGLGAPAEEPGESGSPAEEPGRSGTPGGAP